jgi:hypothetical protein
MLFMPALANISFSWAGLGIAALVLALLWIVVRLVLKITLRLFAIGCLGILILAGIAFVMVYWK